MAEIVVDFARMRTSSEMSSRLPLIAATLLAGCALPHAELRGPTDSPSADATSEDVRPVDVVDVVERDADAAMDADGSMIGDAMDVMDVMDAMDVPDTGIDTGIDTGVDTGIDTGVDTGIDTGVCPMPMMQCSGVCTDVSTSLTNCGMCGRSCGATEVCRAGSCAPPVDCAELQRVRGSASGSYSLDHDNDARTPTVLLYCDMTSAGGPWTVVFNSSGINYSSSTTIAMQWNLSPALGTRSTRMMVALRTSAGAIVEPTSVATFALPTELRSENPFAVANRDIMLMSATVGGVVTTTTLRYGYQTFQSACTDPWNASNVWGRWCMTATHAPYYSGFAHPSGASGNACSFSDGVGGTASCGADRRFTVAVAP